jgi:isopenicillin N synthase-like dioxygenase
MDGTLDPSLPVIDLSPLDGGDEAVAARLAREIDAACRDIGFFLIAGHGVLRPVVDGWFGASRAFFESPAAQKQLSAPDANSLHNGYHGMSASTLAQGEGAESPPDLREYYMIGRLDLADPYFQSQSAQRFYHRNIWPTEPAAFRSAAEAYYRAVERLGARLMRLFALALSLPEAYFDDKIDRHFAVLSSIFYPVRDIAPQAGQLRAGAHTDYGSLTILAPTDAPGGLQIKARSGAWIDVPYVPDAFIINIGDMMARWTNDRWVSTMHRVVNPPMTGAPIKPRQSVAYFLHPNYDAVIECLPSCRSDAAPPRYAPILAGDYMLAKEAKINAAAIEAAAP